MITFPFIKKEIGKVEAVLGEEFYSHGKRIPLVKEAMDEIDNSNIDLDYFDGNYGFARSELIRIGTKLPMWKKLSAIVHELVHVHQFRAEQRVGFTMEAIVLKAGIGEYLKYVIEKEVEAYIKEILVLEQMPEELRDYSFNYDYNSFKEKPLKSILPTLKVDGECYYRWLYKGWSRNLIEAGYSLGARGEVLSCKEITTRAIKS